MVINHLTEYLPEILFCSTRPCATFLHTRGFLMGNILVKFNTLQLQPYAIYQIPLLNYAHYICKRLILEYVFLVASEQMC